MKRLTVLEGIPRPYDKLKRVVVPGALRLLRLKPNRKYCRLGDLAASIGWGYHDLIRKLEDKRKVKSAAWYVKKKQHRALKAKAISSIQDKLKKLGKIHVATKPPRPGPPGLGKSFSSGPKDAKSKPASKPESKSPDTKPKGDKPKGDKPKGDKPKADKGDKPKGDKAEKPKADKGDKPKADKPKDAKPKEDKPKKDPKAKAATTAATSS
jgi:hypothetical protein